MANSSESADDDLEAEIVEDVEVVDDEQERVAVPRQHGKLRRRKKKINVHEEDEKFRRSVTWFMLAVGVLMCFGGAINIAGRGAAFRAIWQMCLYLIIMIPVAVGTLMVLGMLVGIDYGEYKRAFLKLTAIAFMNNGVLLVVDGSGAPFLVTLPICMLVCYGLFMVLYDLDFWEAWISITTIQMVEFGAKFLLMMAMMASERHKEKKQKLLEDDLPDGESRIENVYLASAANKKRDHELNELHESKPRVGGHG